MYEHGGNKNKGSQKLYDYNSPQHHIESGYICVDALVFTFYHIKKEHHCNDINEPHFYKHKGTKEVCAVQYGSEWMTKKKKIKTIQENLKVCVFVLPTCRIYVEAGFIAATNTISILNQNSKGEEEGTNK